MKVCPLFTLIHLKNKYNHSLLSSAAATLSKHPSSPAWVILVVVFLVSLPLLLFSLLDTATRAIVLKSKSDSFYCYVKKPFGGFSYRFEYKPEYNSAY